MTPGHEPSEDLLRQRVVELEAQLQDSLDTLDAIRRGEIDAVVVSGQTAEQRVYTLENADRPYRLLIEQIHEGAVTLSPDGTIFYCNRRLADMLGLPQEQVIGKKLQPFLAAAEISMFQTLLAAADNGWSRGEFLIRQLSGAELPVYISLSPLPREEGDALICGVVADLTQQKLHLSELEQTNVRLKLEIAQREAVEDALRQSQKMEAVGQLTGGLAHDFNNLLTGIMGSLQLIEARIAQGRTGELGRYVEAAMSSAGRAASLTHRLLAFSRRQTLDPKPVAVNRLIMDMEDLLRRTLGPTITLEMILPDSIGMILCDPNQLENALLNLVINARDAMPGGGTLTIATSDSEIEEMFALQRDMSPGRYMTLAVTDTGTGMSPEVTARAFDPFFTTKPLGEGTGLGLSMIYGFAKQSGGQVRIHSDLGVGTTMRIHLPVHEDLSASQAVEGAQPALDRAEAGETVLIVDDEPIVRMLVVEALQDLGYSAIEANDGASGLRLLEKLDRIDLLVTDVGLPGGMNGRQLADHARSRRPGLKVLFITGFAEGSTAGLGSMEPGMEILTKPFAMDELAARIQGMISGADSSRADSSRAGAPVR